jgi:hypothetical protein
VLAVVEIKVMIKRQVIVGGLLVLLSTALVWSLLGAPHGLRTSESTKDPTQTMSLAGTTSQPEANSTQTARAIGPQSASQKLDTPAPVQHPMDQSFSTSSLPDWKIYTNTHYGYQFSYPNTDAFLSDSGALSDLPLSYSSRQVVNLYMMESLDQQEAVMVNVGVYDKPATTSLRNWILKGYEQGVGTSQPPRGYPQEGSTTISQNIDHIPSGAIDTALAKAANKEVGVLTFTEMKQGDLSVYEVGVVGIYGALSYTRYITKDDRNYLYAVDINLPFEYVDTVHYRTIYKQIVASFKILARPK